MGEKRERERGGDREAGKGGLEAHYWADLHLIAIYNQVLKPLEMGVKNGREGSRAP